MHGILYSHECSAYSYPAQLSTAPNIQNSKKKESLLFKWNKRISLLGFPPNRREERASGRAGAKNFPLDEKEGLTKRWVYTHYRACAAHEPLQDTRVYTSRWGLRER